MEIPPFPSAPDGAEGKVGANKRKDKEKCKGYFLNHIHLVFLLYKADYAHVASTFRAFQWIYFVNLLYHSRPP